MSSNRQVKYYTDLPSVKHFELLYHFVVTESKYYATLVWPKKILLVNVVQKYAKIPRKSGGQRKLIVKAELLLVLMTLRLRLANQEIGDGFGV